MTGRNDRHQDQFGPGEIVERRGVGILLVVAVIASLVIVGLSYILHLRPQTEAPAASPPIIYLAKPIGYLAKSAERG
jgi:hypothetical protein